MAACHLSSKCWFSAWIAVLLLSSLIYANEEPTEAKPTEPGKPSTENTLPSSTSSSNIVGQQSSQELTSTSSSFTYHSSSQDVSDILPSTLDSVISKCSATVCSNNLLFTSSLSPSQDVAISTTSIKYSSPGVDVSSFLTSSASNYVISTGIATSISQSIRPSATIASTHSVPNQSKVVNMSDTTVSQISSSSPLIRTSTPLLNNSTSTYAVPSSSLIYKPSSSVLIAENNTLINIVTTSVKSFSSSSIMTSSMSSSGSSLSTPITSTNSSNFMIITPSPSIVQTSTISSTPAMSPNMSSSSSVASTPLPGIPSSSAPTSTMMVVSLTTSELFVPSSSVLSTIAITSSLSSAQVTTSVPVVPTTPPKPPSSPPLNVTAYGRNSTSIMLSWQPPPTDTLNGELQKYEVKIEKVASDKCLSVTVTSKVNPSKSTPSSSFTSVSSATSTKLSSSSVSKQSSYSSTTSNYTRTPSVEPSSTTQTTAEPSSMTIVPTTPIEPTQPTVPMTPIEPTLPTELPKSPKTTSRLDRDLIDAGKNLSIMLGNLEVLTCYEIRVRVVTSLPGNWSSPVLAKTSQDPKPIAPPVDVRATAMSSSSLLVEWQPPPPQDRHGLIKHYIVEYYIKRDDIQYKSTAGNATRLTLTSLKPFTQYYVRVKAVNGAGAGPESEAVTNTTFEDEPSPPTNFTVRSVNVTSLFVSWGRPESLNGALVKYKLYYRQTVFNTSKDSLVYDGKDTKFVLTGLKKFTNYTLTLFAYNVRYGYRSTAVVATENTHPSVPSEPVDLQASNVTATSCFVTWKQPKHINGILSYYQVQYRPYASSSDPQNVTTGLSTSTTLQSMHAFTLYVIYVQAATGQGLGPPAILYVNTTEGVPSAIPYLQPYNVMSRSISIQWDAPKTPNGHIGYRLIYGLSDLSWIKTLEFTVTINKRVVTQLVPYTNYTFTISAYNIKSGQSGPSRSITEQTSPGIPSPPRNIRLTNRTAHSLAVTWDPPANPYGKISHYMIKVFAVENDRFLDTQRVDGQTFTVEPLKPYHEYTVYVSCTTNGGDSENSLRKTFRTLPSVPPTVQPIKPPSKDGITQDQIVIELEKASDSNGKISYYQVIVLELETNSNGNVIIPDENPDDYPPEKMFTYVGAKQQKPDLVPYIAAQFPASDFTKYRLFKVGDGNNFSIGARKRRDTTDQYFNGPLDPSTFYTMFQRAAINKDIYVSSEWTDPVATSEKAVASKKQSVPKTNVGLVAGVCVTLLLLIVIAIILFSFLWKKRRFAFGMMLDDEGDYSNRSFKLKKIRGHKRRRTSSRGLMGSTDSLDNLDDLSRRRQPIPVEDFANHVRRMHIDGDIGFSEEYELVQPDDKEFTWHHSLMPVNKHKNRYANIVAYDHSRVLLSPVENVQGSDYINANYIDGYSRSGAYIACQGPLPESFDDFWRMLWEQGTATIVMLTQLEERGRRKCDQYWPDRGTHMYGVIRVTASETSHMSYYTLRVFMISHKQDEEEPRQVKQYHFTSWPDHGVPTHPAPLLSLVRTVANANPSTAGPCLVHCSAGVGRTGTYIALDSSLQRIEKEQTLDIFDFVQQMRMKRNLMVQTESQYIFIHDALVEAVSCGVTEFEAKKCATRIRELREVDPDNGRTYMEKEFLRLLKDERHHSTFKAANMGVNSSKNRYLNILPYENTRVPLKMRPGEVGSDYVNASYIDGYCRQRVYIATQAPLPSTFEDYWRMIWEQGSCVIVMLTREEEAGKVKCHRYWPSDGTRIFGDVLVELTEEVSYTDYTMRQFNLTHTEEKDSRVVRQYQYTDWPDVGLPESGVGIIDLIGQVEKWQQQSNNSVITVHCSGGVGRTGVYCAISILIERVKAEGVIDVFQTVQSLRLQRPAMVQILEQYEFCYSTLQEYLESFDLYANFN